MVCIMQGIELVSWRVSTGFSVAARNEASSRELGLSISLAAKGDYTGYNT